jgi:hypothetical protein
MVISQRFSRYHCTSNPPPYLECVLKQLRKASQGRGSIRNKTEARALAVKADKGYEKRGQADDLVRFLLNTGILIETEEASVLYFDDERALHVLECCDGAKEPQTAANPAKRVRSILKRISEAASVGAGSASTRATDEGVPASEPQAQAPEQPAMPAAPQPPCLVELTRVMYLTPDEEDVWSTLALSVVELAGQMMLTLPYGDAAGRSVWVANNLKCSEDAFVRIMERLEASGLLRPTVQMAGGLCVWRLSAHPFSIHVVKITEREVRETRARDVAVVRALETEFDARSASPLMPAFKEFVRARFPELNPGGLYTKMVGYNPKYAFQNWGILFRHQQGEGSVVTLPCVPGFESLVMKARAEAAEAVQDELPVIEVEVARAEAVAFEQTATMPSPPPDEPSPDCGSVPEVEMPVMESPPPAPASVDLDEQRRVIIEKADDEGLADIIRLTRDKLEHLKRTLLEAEAEKERRESAYFDGLVSRQRALEDERSTLEARLKAVGSELAEIESKLPPQDHPYWLPRGK